MSTRITLLVHAPTASQRAARVPDAADAIETVPPAQLAALAAGLGRVDQAWCSPAQAAWETAALLELAPTIEPMLADLDLGRWKCRPLSEIAAEGPGMQLWLESGVGEPHGGESIAALLARVRRWMDRIGSAGGRHLAITHAGVARAAILRAFDLGAESFRSVDPEPLGMVRIDERNGRWTLRALIPRPSMRA